MEEFKRLSRDLVQRGAIIDYYQDTIQVPNGNIVKWDFIKHNGAAAVVPVDDQGRLVMVRQYRNALDRYTLEIPAGGRDSVEEPYIDCAARELEEETGYKTAKENLEFLISLRTTVAFCNERIDVFVAKDLKPSHQHLDEDEFIDVEAFTIDELLEMIYSGKMQDAKTISSLLAYKVKYQA